MKRPTPTARTLFAPLSLLLLAFLFSFRLWFGLVSDTWYQIQIFILGLKCYSAGDWPYFGPSVAENIQLPGALQAFLVSIPLKVWPAPESPILLLGILSFSALLLWGWYLSKRLPAYPAWILWGWLMTAPWALDWSTQLDNDSYILFGSVLFFIGFLETVPAFRLGLLPPALCDFMMGFALLWCAQMHMSFVLLGPFLLYSAYCQWKTQKGGQVLRSLGAFLAGALLVGSLAIPTFLQFGLSGSGRSEHSVTLNLENAGSLFTVLFRYLSFGACEIARYIGAHSQDRLAFLKAYPWAAPFTVIAFLTGLVQVLLLFVGWFLGKKGPGPWVAPFLGKFGWKAATLPKDWTAVKALVLATFLLIYGSFLFSIKPPAAHTFYITFPIVMFYAFTFFAPLASKPVFKAWAAVLLVSNLICHTALGISNIPTRSIYKDRSLFIRAIAEKNYHLLGERRADTRY